MIYYLTGVILTFYEACGCLLFFDIFSEKRSRKKGPNALLFLILLSAFYLIGFLSASFWGDVKFFLKIILAILTIIIVMSVYCKSSPLKIVFLATGFYAISFAIDYVLLILTQTDSLESSARVTIVALFSKTLMLLVIFFLSRKLKKGNGLGLITSAEWIRFLFLPILSILSMAWFIVSGFDDINAVIFVTFGLASANFISFYIIRDIIQRDNSILKARLAEERYKPRYCQRNN
ncbi:MAG: hypothetical protein FWG91_10630 [Lachnospiraceae bacterium]|nr:hypothetical protein [Lachnospiraceae bacterium]